MGARRDSEDIIQLLKGALLGLGHPEEDHDEREHVQASVETEHALRLQRLQHTRQCQGKHGTPEVVCRDGPAHAHLAVAEGEDFGGVCEGDGALAGAVEGAEKVDEEGDQAQVGLVLVGDVVAHARGQERPEHVGEREEKQAAATEGIDGPDGGPGEGEIDEAEAQRGEESLLFAEAALAEDGAGVEGDDVDAAHLLADHDDTGGLGGAAHTGNREEFDETGEEGALRAHTEGLDKLLFLLQETMCVVEITGSLERRVAQTAEGLERLDILLLAHQPSRRLRAEVDTKAQGNRRDEGRAELEAPGDLASVHNGHVGDGTKEDAKGGPDLPAHDQATTNGSRRVFSREDRNRDLLETHANAKQNTADGELRPCLGRSHANRSQEREDGSDEDGMATAKQVVDGIRDPCAAVSRVSERKLGIKGQDLQESNGDVRASVDEANDPAVLLAGACGLTDRAIVGDAESIAKSQVSTVAASLIPALDSGGNRVHDDGEVQDPRLLEAMSALFAQGDLLGLIELVQLFEQERSLGDKCTLAQQSCLRLEAPTRRKVVNVRKELLLGDADKRVADSVKVSKALEVMCCGEDLLALDIGRQLGNAGPALLFIVHQRAAALSAVGISAGVELAAVQEAVNKGGRHT